mmetsp:Transcript_15668/g.17698  ORF Transcript_15668/g.17698 Transcript_15668/m.17698 type:complete len:87 (+) Transcript_15668:61-321(+)
MKIQDKAVFCDDLSKAYKEGCSSLFPSNKALVKDCVSKIELWNLSCISRLEKESNQTLAESAAKLGEELGELVIPLFNIEKVQARK